MSTFCCVKDLLSLVFVISGGHVEGLIYLALVKSILGISSICYVMSSVCYVDF